MQTPDEIILRMQKVVRPGRQVLADSECRRLSDLTQTLLASKPEARAEYGRFLSAGQKNVDLPGDILATFLGGKRILVTGGTGCVGSALMAQIARFRPLGW